MVTSNINIGNKLKELGYDVKVLDYSEIVKGEGSVDYSTLALLKEWLLLDFFKLEDAGKICVYGVKEKGDIKGNKALKEAYELGLNLI